VLIQAHVYQLRRMMLSYPDVCVKLVCYWRWVTTLPCLLVDGIGWDAISLCGSTWICVVMVELMLELSTTTW